MKNNKETVKAKVEAKLACLNPADRNELMAKNFEDAYRIYGTVKAIAEYVVSCH